MKIALIGLLGLVLSEILLFGIFTRLLSRLKDISYTLPLLASGQFEGFRHSLATIKRKQKYSDEIDMLISGLTMTIDRNKKVAFIGPYLISGNTMLTKDERFKKAQSIEDIDKEGVKIVVMQGTTSEEFAKANITKAILFKSATTKLALQMLIDGKVDVMIGAYPTVSLVLLDHRGEGFFTSSELLDYEPIGIAVAPSDPLLLNLVSNYLTALERTGILDLLKTKWFEEGSWILEAPIQIED